MKCLLALSLVFLVATAEPPRGQSARQAAAPYSPSGWKPSGAAFALPPRQTLAKQYAAPQSTYGAPQNTYGGPQQAEPALEPEAENIELSVFTNVQSERLTKGPKRQRLTKKKKSEKLQDATVQPNQVLYYVLPQYQQSLVLATPPQGLQYYANLQTQQPLVYANQYVQQAW